MMYLVGVVMKFAPYGTFGLIVTAIGSQGLDAIKAMGLYFTVVLVALLVHFFLTYGSTLAIFAKRNPFTFFKDFHLRWSWHLVHQAVMRFCPYQWKPLKRN